jgi:hypothetical protein
MAATILRARLLELTELGEDTAAFERLINVDADGEEEEETPEWACLINVLCSCEEFKTTGSSIPLPENRERRRMGAVSLKE